MPNVEIKDYVLPDGKSVFHIPIKTKLSHSYKNKEEAYGKIMKVNRNNDYTTGNLMHYKYFSKHYELIAIDSSKQIELENPGIMQ